MILHRVSLWPRCILWRVPPRVPAGSGGFGEILIWRNKHMAWDIPIKIGWLQNAFRCIQAGSECRDKLCWTGSGGFRRVLPGPGGFCRGFWVNRIRQLQAASQGVGRFNRFRGILGGTVMRRNKHLVLDISTRTSVLESRLWQAQATSEAAGRFWRVPWTSAGITHGSYQCMAIAMGNKGTIFRSKLLRRLASRLDNFASKLLVCRMDIQCTGHPVWFVVVVLLLPPRLHAWQHYNFSYLQTGSTGFRRGPSGSSRFGGFGGRH